MTLGGWRGPGAPWRLPEARDIIVRRLMGFAYRHGWSLVAFAAGLYLASRIHQKPSWADPDFTHDNGLGLMLWTVTSVTVLLACVVLAVARRTYRIVEAAAVLVGTFVLAGVVLAATNPTPVTGTATVEGLPSQPALVSGPVECTGLSGRVSRIDALPDWKIVLLPERVPPQMFVEVSVGPDFTSLEGQLATEKLADAWVRGRAVLSYELAAGPGVLTFTWDCGHAPVLSPTTSLLWWITGDGLLPWFIVVVALLSLGAGLRGRADSRSRADRRPARDSQYDEAGPDQRT